MAETFKPCSVDGCNGNAGHSARGRNGYCSRHYQRMKKHGSPLAGRTAEGEPARFLAEVVMTYDGDRCLEWPFNRNSAGYGMIRREGVGVLVSRLVCEAVNGPAPTPRHDAAHTCGKGHMACCAKSHLLWKSRAENMADMLLHGTNRPGEQNPCSKLSEADVKQILAEKGKMSLPQTAARFGVSRSNIWMIQSGKTWRHLAVASLAEQQAAMRPQGGA